MNCLYCQLREENRNILYQDEEVVAALAEEALTAGQVMVFPTEHITILELVPPMILAKCASLANKIGMAIFEALGVQGTNIIVRNGLGSGQKVPHFALEIIPRQENDNLPLLWSPTTLTDEELESTIAILKEEGKKEKKIEAKEQSKTDKAEAKDMKKENPKKEEPQKDDAKEDNHLLSNIRRIP